MKLEDITTEAPAITTASNSWPNSISLHLSQSGTNNHNLAQTSSKNGVPLCQPPTRWTAPVHLDVGGTIYTTTLITLTK